MLVCVVNSADKAPTYSGCPTHADTDHDQLPLIKVKEATKDLRSDWYSLAVELEISHGVRKVGVYMCLVYG